MPDSHLLTVAAPSPPLETEVLAQARGPFRPTAWLNARQRADVRLAGRHFRVVEGLALIGAALMAFFIATQGQISGAATLATGAPLLGAATVMAALPGILAAPSLSQQRAWALQLCTILAGGGVAAAVAAAIDRVVGGAGLETALWFAAGSTVVLVVLQGVWLSLIARWRRLGVLTPNIVIVGATKLAERLIERAYARRDINVLGVFDDRLARTPDRLSGVPVLGDSRALQGHRMAPYVDQVVLAIDAPEPRGRDLARGLQRLPNRLVMMLGDDDPDVVIDRIAALPLASSGRVADDRRAFHKRMQDLVLGGMGLIAAAPVMAAIALAIRLDSPGPVFFRQRRHGFNQEEIVVWKFRSMRHEAADATASRQVAVGDDRVTRVGRFIRATSLDELPQLFNVLSGEMSLVGPRPHAIGMKTGEIESARLVADYAHRHRIKPGMTGWAAIKGSRGPVSTEEEVRRRVQLDLEYIERQSFWLDLWIALVTVPVLLGDRAAVR